MYLQPCVYIELMHIIGKGQFMMEGCDGMSCADQFYTLAG
jgi:hypothetical protein